jgi:hypothetical protein
MHRRYFLASASAVVLAAKLLQPTLAASAPADKYEDINFYALESAEKMYDIMTAYDLDLKAKARHLGGNPDKVKEFGELPPALSELPNLPATFYSRIIHFMVIWNTLERYFGPTTDKHMAWLAWREPLPQRSCLDLLKTGDIKDVIRVSQFVELQLS